MSFAFRDVYVKKVPVSSKKTPRLAECGRDNSQSQSLLNLSQEDKFPRGGKIPLGDLKAVEVYP